LILVSNWVFSSNNIADYTDYSDYFCWMNNRTFYYCFLLLIFCACKSKQTEKEKSHYISIPSLIREQINHIDTALYSITRVVQTDSLHSDTTFINRDDFETEAKEFLDIPDLSVSKNAKRYTPDSAIYDEVLNRVIITYNSNDPKEPFTRQQLLITPHPGSTDKVNSIVVTYAMTNKDGAVRKEMLWLLDQSFQIVTTTQLPGQPEKTTTKKVTWNDQSDE